MALETDLARSPYFNDYLSNSNHYAVLYRPGVAVQAREMNAAQSMLQDQIDKFGRSIYKEGSVIEGCAFTFDDRYAYVKIRDNYANGSAFSIGDFVGRVVNNANGLKARIVNAAIGYESQAPDLNTLYLKYLNTGTHVNGAVQMMFSNGENLSISTTGSVLVGNVTVANTESPVGYGYAMTVSEGVIFKKGYFIRVAPQTTVISKYSNVPTGISAGFAAVESIETSTSNTELYDNAQGTPNYGAPGAHRLKLTPVLVIKNTNEISQNDTFFSICDFNGGYPVTIKSDPQLKVIGKELARRTYETNGDFVINPFELSVERKKANNVSTNNSTNTTHLSLVSSPGLGYAKGYRVEFNNRYAVDLRKGTDTAEFTSRISANFGYYIYCNEFVGDFNTDSITQVELHSTAYEAVSNATFLDTTYTAGNKIGTAYIRGIEYSSGTPGTGSSEYLIYLFNINMSAGYNFSSAKSLVYQTSSNINAVSDIVLTYDAASNSNLAKLEEIATSVMVFPFGQKAIVANSFSDIAYTYRNRANTSFNTSGLALITLDPAAGVGSETFTYGAGTLGQSQLETFIIIPQVDGYSSAITGNVTVNVTSNIVIGNSTGFTSVFRVGDVVRVSNSTYADERVITSITNSTYMQVTGNFSNTISGANAQMVFPAGLPISMLNRSGRSIAITSNTTANVTLGITPNTAFDVWVYHDILRSSTVPTQKKIRRNTIVKIDTSNNAAGTIGPWCLGVTDALKINHVWVSAGSYANTLTGVDTKSSFVLDSGQRDAYYDLAYLRRGTGSKGSLAPGSLILVSVDHFEHDDTQGKGFFTANSYPVDDVNSSNTDGINTAEIPVFTSPTKGTVFDLRDCVDFRPYVANTATWTSNTTLSTVNPNSTISFTGATDSSIPGSNGSYIIAPNQLFECRLNQYLSRKDIVSITTSGELKVTEGRPAVNPIAPVEPNGTMTLGMVDVKPYPTLSAYEAKQYRRYDYTPVISYSQIRRYTMADIGTLDTRIYRLEKYTNLSELERKTEALTVRSDITGLNRFKNGFFVDPFSDHVIGDTLNPQYSIAIDKTRAEARPSIRIVDLQLKMDDAISVGVKHVGYKIVPEFSQIMSQSQPYASAYLNCINGKEFNWTGTVSLFPPGDLEPDRTVSPDTGDPTIDPNLTDLPDEKSGTTVWPPIETTTPPPPPPPPEEPTTTDPTRTIDGYITPVLPRNSVNEKSMLVDKPVTAMRSTQFFFSARGMRPGAVLKCYFGGADITRFVRHLLPYSGEVELKNGMRFGTIDESPNPVHLYVVYQSGITTDKVFYLRDKPGQLVVQSDGSVRGLVRIPQGTFKSSNMKFELVDYDSSLGDRFSSTIASTTFAGSWYALWGSDPSGLKSINLQTRDLQESSYTVSSFDNIDRLRALNNEPVPIINAGVPPLYPSDSAADFDEPVVISGITQPSSIFVPDSNIRYLPTPIPNFDLTTLADTLIQPATVEIPVPPTAQVPVLVPGVPPTPAPVPIPVTNIITVALPTNVELATPVAIPTPIPTPITVADIPPQSIGSDLIGVFPPVSTTSTSVSTQQSPPPPEPVPWSPEEEDVVHILPVLTVPPIIDASPTKLINDWSDTPSIYTVNQTQISNIFSARYGFDSYVQPPSPPTAIAVARPDPILAPDPLPNNPPSVWDSEIKNPPIYRYQTDYHFSDGGAV